MIGDTEIMEDNADKDVFALKEIQESESESSLPNEQVDDLLTDSRDIWGSRVEYLLALIGYTVGIGSIWRFPILCVRNGGGAFLLLFCLNVAFIVGPIYYLEMNLGQFTGKSPCKAYEFCPLFKGLGYLAVVLTILSLYYFVTIMAWIIYYFYSSFSTVLPWSTCDNEWNTPHCYSISDTLGNLSATTRYSYNTTNRSSTQLILLNFKSNSSSTFEFWNNQVIQRSSGLEDVGSVQAHLAVCLFIAWMMTVLGVIKGVKSLGKVVYFTALFPYVLLTILLVRGLTLEGSVDGITYLLKFDVEKLADLQVWFDAAVQVFYSMGPVWGSVIVMSSHNKYNQPTLVNTVIICGMEVFTAIFATSVLFSVIGFMANEVGVPVDELAKSSGVGLAFLAYPTAVSLMPFPQIWAVLFFSMMILVMLDTLFAMVETILGCLEDFSPSAMRKHRIFLTIGFAVVMFLMGLIFLTNGGIYLFQLFDWYLTIFGLFVGGTFEVASLSLIYGIDRFSGDISTMTGRTMSRFARFLFCIIIPTVTCVTFMLMLTHYKEPDYGDEYQYKRYAIVIGFTVSLIPVVAGIIPGVCVLLRHEGSLWTRIHKSLQPSKKWASRDRKVNEMRRCNPYVYEETLLERLKMNLLGPKDTPII